LHAFQLLRLVALMETPDITVVVAAALAGETVNLAQAALDQLTESQLLETAPSGRYRVHDLVRLCVQEQATAETAEPERHAALLRAFAHYEAVGRGGTVDRTAGAES
jgi:hypothetical protein